MRPLFRRDHGHAAGRCRSDSSPDDRNDSRQLRLSIVLGVALEKLNLLVEQQAVLLLLLNRLGGGN